MCVREFAREGEGVCEYQCREEEPLQDETTMTTMQTVALVLVLIVEVLVEVVVAVMLLLLLDSGIVQKFY